MAPAQRRGFPGAYASDKHPAAKDLERHGCQNCHSGNGIGKDLGGLTLDGSSNLIYKELVEERPDTRVNRAKPEASLVLTMPSREDPPDGHPNVTFTGPADPDYLKLLVWIREGAHQN